MSNRHKWYKEIQAWSEGAVIEWTFRGLCEWHTDTRPDWADGRCDFRIKTQPKEPQYLYAYSYDGLIVWSESNQNIADRFVFIGKIEVQND